MAVAAFIMGFVGSLHCVGMCGPLAMLIRGRGNAIVNRLAYNSGRILTYACMGIVVGFAGEMVALQGWQQVLSIAAGMTILIIVIFPKVERYLSPPTGRLIANLKARLTEFISQPRLSAAFTTGVLNGFLPCGMVYTALVLASAQGSRWDGLLLMIFFGLGTVPALLAVAFSTEAMRRLTPSWRRIQVGLFVVVAALMIGRGFLGGHGLHFGHSDVTECEP